MNISIYWGMLQIGLSCRNWEKRPWGIPRPGCFSPHCMIPVIGFLETGAKHREKYLMNIYRMARNSIEKGKNEAPYAYVIPQAQKDPNTVAKMINILISGGKRYPAGAIIISGTGIERKLQSLAEEFNLQIQAGSSPCELLELKPLRLGLYKPWVANMDEGWTRWIFDNWEFPFTTLHDDEIRSGHLKQKYDVIVLTDVSSSRIVNGHAEGTVPSQYAGGIGKQGLSALYQFVREGGTLVTLNSSYQLPIDHFKVPLRNISRDFSSSEFFCPSAILEVDVDNTHPIAYGMEKNANILSYGSPVFEFLDGDKAKSNEKQTWLKDVKVVVRYPNSNPFKSGRLIGDHILHNKPALIEVGCGNGRIIIFGFRPQNRAQTHGTFMLFFNSLYYGPALTDSK